MLESGPARHDEHHAAAVKGERLSFDRTIYAAPEVKAALVSAQHGKCCFCESKMQHVSPGDVEHYRPKAAVRVHDGQPLQSPGYYWLAYEWTNLLLACEQCNRRGKKNQFPLRDESKRARSPSARLRDEEPMFVDPSTEEPSKHLGFRREMIHALSDRGETTIAALELNRGPLATRRADRLAELERLEAVVRVLGRARNDEARRLVRSAREELAKAECASAEYTAMWRSAIEAK